MSESLRVDRIADPWGPRTPYGPGDVWPVRVDQHLEPSITEEQVERWVPTASVLHSNGDGLDLAVVDGRLAGVRGRATDRVNHGRVDPKDLFAWQANASPDRLTRPMVRRKGELVEVDWDTAMDCIVERSRELLDGPGGWGRFGFYTSGQLFLEAYYTLAVIGKAGIGTPHMDGNTRLCTATAAAALKASFGTDGQPGSYTEPDVTLLVHRFAQQCEQHRARLVPTLRRYEVETLPEEHVLGDRFEGPRGGPLGLLRDLQDLYVMAAEVDVVWTLVGQAAQGARDDDLLGVVKDCENETSAQMLWLKTRLKQAAPQALVVA